jgi:excisionase family DNA binding protein
MPDTYTTPEVARELGVSVRTLYRWLDRGLIPEPRRAKGDGSSRRWTQADIAQAKRILEHQETTNERYGTLNRVIRDWQASAPRSSLYRATLVRRDAVLTSDALAKRLGVKRAWIYEMTRNERGQVGRSGPRLPRLKGRQLRFSWGQVAAWLNKLTDEWEERGG